jgi:hypothetical protein
MLVTDVGKAAHRLNNAPSSYVWTPFISFATGLRPPIDRPVAAEHKEPPAKTGAGGAMTMPSSPDIDRA